MFLIILQGCAGGIKRKEKANSVYIRYFRINSLPACSFVFGGCPDFNPGCLLYQFDSRYVQKVGK